MACYFTWVSNFRTRYSLGVKILLLVSIEVISESLKGIENFTLIFHGVKIHSNIKRKRRNTIRGVKRYVLVDFWRKN